MIIFCLIIVAPVAALLLARAYLAWRINRPLIASNADLWAHTLPYEPAARERRQ
jgi:hypothetical protein